MKLSEYAKKININYRTVYNWFKKGMIPNAVQLKNGTILIVEDVNKIPEELKKNNLNFNEKTSRFKRNSKWL